MERARTKSPRIWVILILGLILAFLIGLTATAQDPIPHTEDDATYEDCVSCHLTGEDDAPVMPDDHADLENAKCSLCHGAAGSPPAQVNPSDIPHPVVEWEDCLGCHQRWDGVRVDIPNIAGAIRDHTAFAIEDCTICHDVASETDAGIPEIACGTCHPKNAAAETAHNNPDTWSECTDCHQTADSYPHDPELVLSQDEDCLSCHAEWEDRKAVDAPHDEYDLSDHIAWGAPHVTVDCSACHLQYAVVERNRATGRVRPVLPAVVGVPPDTPEWAYVDRPVDCQRCHFSGSTVAAPATTPPARNALCLACHDASPVLNDGLSWAGASIFGLGMVMTASIWLRGSVGGLPGLSLPARLWYILQTSFRFVYSLRFFSFLWALVRDGILHVDLFRTSKQRWLAHALMFLGIMARMALGIFTWLMTQWAPALPLTQALIDKNSPAIAFIYDALGLVVILGGVLAVVRRFIVKDEQLITGQQDIVAIALIGAIFAMGFVVEAGRILTTVPQPNMVIYSFVGYALALVLKPIPVDWGVIYGPLWYVHAGLVVALAAYLPFSKFIHVLVGPFVAALNSVLEER